MEVCLLTCYSLLYDNMEVRPLTCYRLLQDNMEVCPLTAGRIASYYYISNLSVQTFTNTLKPVSTVPDILDVLSVSRAGLRI